MLRCTARDILSIYHNLYNIAWLNEKYFTDSLAKQLSFLEKKIKFVCIFISSFEFFARHFWNININVFAQLLWLRTDQKTKKIQASFITGLNPTQRWALGLCREMLYTAHFHLLNFKHLHLTQTFQCFTIQNKNVLIILLLSCRWYLPILIISHSWKV